MSDKSVQKKKYILETARRVFGEKGYGCVTMKDIVEACGISRGGLYLYFSSTKELFLEVLQLEQLETDDVFEKNIPKEAGPAAILALFLKEQKKELLERNQGLSRASYEFLFEHAKEEGENFMKKQFDSAVLVIQKLIEAGVESGEFYCEDPRRAASNIMSVLEGLKIASLTRGITQAAVDREIMYVMQGLIIED